MFIFFIIFLCFVHYIILDQNKTTWVEPYMHHLYHLNNPNLVKNRLPFLWFIIFLIFKILHLYLWIINKEIQLEIFLKFFSLFLFKENYHQNLVQVFSMIFHLVHYLITLINLTCLHQKFTLKNLIFWEDKLIILLSFIFIFLN